MIQRSLKKILKESATWARVISIVGPRQSGKKTLAQDTFSDYHYISFEDPTNREFAKNDPKGFLENAQKNQNGIILNEFRYVPELLSYIQLLVDQLNRTGYFVLTGNWQEMLKTIMLYMPEAKVKREVTQKLSLGQMQKI